MFRSFILLFCILCPFFVSAMETISRDATYYSDGFEWGGTSYGDTFSQDGYSAAVCDIDLGQWLHITNGIQSVVVKANDRPNCDRHPELIDLSKKAFSVLGTFEMGRIPGISVTPIGSWTHGFIRKDIDPHTFQSLSVQLDSALSNLYFAGETILISGKVLDGKKNVLIYLQDTTSQKEQSQLLPVKSDGTFLWALTLPQNPGKYSFIIASGNSFQTSLQTTLTLIGESDFSYPRLPITNIRFSPKIEDKTMVLPKNTWWILNMVQDTQKYTVKWSAFTVAPIWFHPGKVQVEMSGYSTPTGFSLDRNAIIPKLFSGTVLLDRIHTVYGEKNVRKTIGKRSVTLRFSTPADIRIRSNYYVTTPSGDVLEYTFPVSFMAEDGFLKVRQAITMTIPMPDEGTYLIETVREDGTAYFNIPVNRGIVWNILSPMSYEDATTMRKNINLIRASWLKRINTLRAGLDRNLLVTDPVLERLAQMKADDMANRGYFGHRNPEGLYINDFAKQKGIDLKTTIYENIGYGEGSISDLALQDGLEESGSHRHSMVLPKVTQVGIGYAKNGEKTYLVQVFGE